MTRFWGKLFGINFAMGVTTGITMEFQFGTNWAYYSHYVGDIFGAPLAIEGLMAFFLESTFVGLFFFGWDRLSQGRAPGRHVPRRAGLEPVGAVDPDRQRLDAEPGRRRVQLRDDADGAHELHATLIFNPVAQVEVRAHASPPATSPRPCSCSASRRYYLLKARDMSFALRSFAVAAGFGLASTLSVIVLGDESGYTTGEVAEGEARGDRGRMGDAEAAGRRSRVFGFPDQAAETHATTRSRFPWLIGLIATRSVDTPVTGIKDLKAEHEARIRNGMMAYAALQTLEVRRQVARSEGASSTSSRTTSATACC